MMDELSLILKINRAILSLCPGAQFSVIGDSLDVDKDGYLKCVRWNDTKYDQPKATDIIAKIETVTDNWNNTQYQRQRAPEYPSIGDQLDALFHAGVFPPEMAAQIQAVKDKYPKGS